MQDKIKELKTTILSQAKYFLEESGEFYPFAFVISKENRIKPIGAYFEGDYPSSAAIVELLEKTVFDGLKKKEYLLGAVASDVFTNIDNEQRSALQIRIYDGDANEVSSTFYSYFKKVESYFFREIGAS